MLLGRGSKNSAATRYRSGMQAFNAGQFDTALQDFEAAAAASRDPSDPVLGLARFYAGEAALHLGFEALPQQPEAALRCFETARHHGSYGPDLHLASAAAEALLGRPEASLAQLRLALDLEPEHLEARCLLGLVLHDLGTADAARRELEWVSAHAELQRRPLPSFVKAMLVKHAPALPQLEPLARLLGVTLDSEATPILSQGGPGTARRR